MWWKTSPDLTVPLRHLEERLERLDELFSDLRNNLSETSHDVRALDVDMGTLEQKFMALSGRVSVKKRRDRAPEAEPEPELDLNERIRTGELTSL